MSSIHPPPVPTPWSTWAKEVEAALDYNGAWTGSYAQVLTWAAARLNIASGNERQRSSTEGWNTPEGLFQRYCRLHRVDWGVTGDLLTIKKRAREPKKRRPVPPAGPGLFD